MTDLPEFCGDDLSLAQCATDALLQELEVFPKPGLVSPIDSGAHTDMDYALMCRSAGALLNPLARISAAGRAGGGFLSALVPLGIAAERDMLAATDGVNTHRGAIFVLGMLVAALARTQALGIPRSPPSVREVLLQTWGDELEAHASGDSESHGGIVRRSTGAGGARAEAASGFPAIFEIGLPAYRSAIASGLDSAAARIQTLFVLMEAAEDTNVIFRGGPEAANFVRRSAAGFLAAGGCSGDGWLARAEELHREFIRRNLSPGGCADLLAGTLLADDSEAQKQLDRRVLVVRTK